MGNRSRYCLLDPYWMVLLGVVKRLSAPADWRRVTE